MIIVATLLIISAIVYLVARALTKYYTDNYTDNYPELDGINNLVPKQRTEISNTDIEFAATNAWVEFNKKNSDDSESFYKGWELAIKWYREQLKSKGNGNK